MAKQTLTQEHIEAINNYGDQIEKIDDPVRQTRQNVGMYIGSKGDFGFFNMAREIYQNAVDQMLMENAPCNNIFFSYNEVTNEVIVEDNGLSIPYDKQLMILETNASKNYNTKAGQKHIGSHGFGAAVTNHLSEDFELTCYHYDGTAYTAHFHEGYLDKKGLHKVPNKEKKNGTRVAFTPSKFLGPCHINPLRLYDMVKHIMSLCHLGATTDLQIIHKNGEVQLEHIVNKDGIITDLIMKTNKPIIAPIIIQGSDGYNDLECAFTWDANPELGENITGYANMCPATGLFIDGFRDGVSKWFGNYMNKIYLAANPRNKTKVKAGDVLTGISAFVSVMVTEAIWDGQAKSVLRTDNIDTFTKEQVMMGLEEWQKQFPADLTKICDYIKEMAVAREKADKMKQKVTTKYAASSIGKGLPAKYARPSGKKNLELFICEGDSAKGPLNDARDKIHQGIMPIRGKFMNAFSHSNKRMFENEEVQSLFMIMFGSPYYSKKWTSADCKFEKIIFATDGDVDGFHIQSLLLRFFVYYLPFLIEDGRVYTCTPPLYSTKGKKKIYFTDRMDLIRYNQKFFSNKYELCDLKKNKFTPTKLTKFLILNQDYKDELESAAKTVRIDPKLLELVLIFYVNKKSNSALKKEIAKNYRFVLEFKEEKGTIIVKVSANYKINTLLFNENTIRICKEVIKIIESNDEMYYKLNGDKMTLYEVMCAYESVSPSVNRYKGLGEMNYKDLGESTILPQSRTLIQYTLEDIKVELQAIREIESDKKKILKEVGIITKADLQD